VFANSPPFPDVHPQKPASLLVTFFDGKVPKAVGGGVERRRRVAGRR
jgi:hypothetical protein